MWIDKYLELDGMRMECIVKSRSLDDHSRMQKLTEEDIQEIKSQAEILVKYVMQKVLIRNREIGK